MRLDRTQKLQLATRDLDKLSTDKISLKESLSSLEHALRQTEEERESVLSKLHEKEQASSSHENLLEDLRTQLRDKSSQL